MMPMASDCRFWSTGFAMDLPGPLLENLFCDEDIKEFLVFFGRSDREGKLGQERPSIVQASVMLYSNLVRRKTLANTKESLVSKLLNQNPPLSNAQLVEELFLATLSRFPTEDERANSVKHLETYRNKGVEDLQWALLNRLEMIVNY